MFPDRHGSNNSFYGKHHTEQTLKLMRKPKSLQFKAKLRRPKSDDQKLRQSLSTKGIPRPWVTLHKKGAKHTSEHNEKIAVTINKMLESGKLVPHAYDYESNKHILLKNQEAQRLETLGYSIKKESWITINGQHYKVDIVGRKNERSIAVEVGLCKKEKLTNLRQAFDEVIHIPYLLSKG